MCISNMNNKAQELGCSSDDKSCLCNKMDYMYGVRDCTAEACPEYNVDSVLQMALSGCPGMFS